MPGPSWSQDSSAAPPASVSQPRPRSPEKVATFTPVSILPKTVKPPYQQAATLSGWPSSTTGLGHNLLIARSQPMNARQNDPPAPPPPTAPPHSSHTPSLEEFRYGAPSARAVRLPTLPCNDATICIKNQIIHPACSTQLRIPSCRLDLKAVSNARLNRQSHRQRQTHRIETRPKVRRRRRQLNRSPRVSFSALTLASPISPATQSPAAPHPHPHPARSAHAVSRRCRARSSALAPAISASVNSSPRWYLIVYSESFSVCPVSSRTAVSSLPTRPSATSFFSPASVTAEAGSHPMPSAPISALASAISRSDTCSHHPPVDTRIRTAFFHEAGLPI